MEKTYDLFAKLHTGFFGEGAIEVLESYPADNGVVFDDLKLSEESARILLFTFTCDVPEDEEDDVLYACRAAANVFFGMNFELWEVDLQEMLYSLTPRQAWGIAERS